MGDSTQSTHRRQSTRRWRKGPILLVLTIAALALLFSGCIRIVSLSLDTNVEAGTDYVIQLHVQPIGNLNDVRGTLAFRHPSGWQVTSVTYAGDQSGTMTRAAAIENYFDVTWEGTPVDAVHNGPKAGYTWWAGYGPVENGHTTDDVTVTIHINTHGVAGTFELDFVTGITDDVDPTGVDDHWESGGIITEAPDGVVLDRAVTLLEAVAPEVLSTNPDFTSRVPITTDPRVTFSEKMDPATINGTRLFVRPDGVGGALPATVSYNTTTKEALIDLDAPLQYDTDYLLVVDSAVEDLAGYKMAADYIVGFTTEEEPLAPQVVAHTPASAATGVAIGADVTATFDQPLDPTTLDESSFILERSQGGGWVDVAATVTYSGATQKGILDPDDDLAYGTVYRASLTTAIEADNGMPLAGTVAWTFTTEAEPAPTFIDVHPEDPYYAAITGLAAAEIISGYMVAPGVWEFRPENPVRRAQFAKMIDGSLVLPVTEDDDDSPFTDLGVDILVPSPGVDNLYPHEYVTVAWENQITNGKTATTFQPYVEISRGQVVTMVIRALQRLHPAALATPPVGYTNTWGTGFSSIHGPNARIAEYNGLLEGLPLTTTASDPYASMPRGEVAQVLWNMMALLD